MCCAVLDFERVPVRLGVTRRWLRQRGRQYRERRGAVLSEGHRRCRRGRGANVDRVHFRSADEDGADIGRKVARQIRSRWFKPRRSPLE
jgi:hypothetical protein